MIEQRNAPDPAHAPDPEFLEAVHAGLSTYPRTLPCRYFYDREGSRLFEEICELPEYYLTRTEDAILRERSDEIAARLPAGVDLVEFGSGTARKTRRLIEALLRRQSTLRYVPIDISGAMLAETAEVLSREYPGLTVDPIAGEYYESMTRAGSERRGPALVLFLGSNLGNFVPDEATAFLKGIGAMLAAEDRFLLGLDMRKPAEVLEAAYDDDAGVTARFNLNLLERINRELGGDFSRGRFCHRGRYNAEEGRIEMHLVSRTDQAVTIAGREYRFAAGESIHTENSYKYSMPQLRSLAARAELRVKESWADDRGWFTLNLLAPA